MRTMMLLCAVLLVAGCGDDGSLFTGGAGGSPGGAAGAGVGASGGTGGQGGTGAAGGIGGSGGTGAQGGAGGTGGIGGSVDICGPDDADDDGDGFTENDGDCNDCNPKINPMAAEIPDAIEGLPADDDCDGLTDDADPDVAGCDTGLALDSESAMDAVWAVGLCDKKGDGTAKYVTSAAYVLSDGSVPGAVVDKEKFHRGHGLLDHFGNASTPKEGERMLALSSGTARNKEEVGYFARNFNKGYDSPPPSTFDGTMHACPGVVLSKSSTQDAIGLEVEAVAPANVQSFEFRSAVFTFDWPARVCSQYTDVYWVNFMHNGKDGNVAHDAFMNQLSANFPLLSQCDCPPDGPGICIAPPNPAPGQPTKQSNCLGVDMLQGTDFDGNTNPETGWTNAGTGWFRTTVPVSPGVAFKIRFTVWDSGAMPNGVKDYNSDTTALVDGFRWKTAAIAEPATTPE